MSINLTESAVKELKRVREEQSFADTDVVRVKIEGGGCSGFSYGMSFQPTEEVAVEDNIYEFEGIRVAVDKKSMLYLDGTTVDWIETLDKRGFSFDNPNATRGCGCGKSFGV